MRRRIPHVLTEPGAPSERNITYGCLRCPFTVTFGREAVHRWEDTDVWPTMIRAAARSGESCPARRHR